MTKSKAASALGKLGGPARAKKLSAKRRREIAAMGGAAAARNRLARLTAGMSVERAVGTLALLPVFAMIYLVFWAREHRIL